MATFSFLPSPVPGHVNPTLAIAAELAERGHEVTYHLPEEYRAQVERPGVRLSPIHLDMRQSYRRYADHYTRFAMFPAWLTAEAEHVLPQVLKQLEGARPDLILYDMTCVWGRLLTKILPGPAALLLSSYVSNEHFSLMGNAHYAPLRERLADSFGVITPVMERVNRAHGIQESPGGLFARDEKVVLVVMPRAFHPAGDTFADPVTFVGSCLRPEPAGPDPVLDGLDPGRRVVYVSIGTVHSLWDEMVQTVCAAFDDGSWQVLLSLGDHTPASALPANVIARPSMPQLRVLRAADAFVTHGGTNSVVEAIAHEVPMVVVPMTPEQEVTADQVSALDLGVQLDHRTVTPAALRSAVEKAAGSDEVRRALRRMRAEQEADGDHVAAADLLERTAASSTPAGAGDRAL
ncbi:macrolide family glycosyltransferase [Sphaerisporangium sp. TRM90804]|uniref:macrolide family glycosyltransferase n=1 Tax=Sphaerisporangium sp. TRM90804 TaxID=3031113 RepID=UPI00244CF588|nr:macrolide family glycosyltransferase [Sphaerisporangium sp. TRM90804]MDH2427197.1 glycosyltransferase [Sphaerisporangium sp. TRM90804]